MMGVTHFAAAQVRELAQDRIKFSSRTYRMLNEVPTVILIFIVLLVVFKPWGHA